MSVEIIDYIDVIDITDDVPIDQVATAPMPRVTKITPRRRPVLPPDSIHRDELATDEGPRNSTGLIALATVGVLLAVLMLLAALAGTLLGQVFGVASSPWLNDAIEAGPLLAVIFGAVATGLGYIAHSRAERAGPQTATPPVWQLATATLLLVASLAVTGLTLAPTPLHVFGTAIGSSSAGTTSATTSSGSQHIQPGGPSIPVVSPVPTATATPAPTPTATPTPVPHLAAALSTTALRQVCPGFYSAMAPATLTLDNTASNVDAQWQVTSIQLIPGTPHPFVSTVMSGTVPAGEQATLTFTPHPKLCYWNPLPGKIYHLTLQIVGGPSITVTDLIVSPKL